MTTRSLMASLAITGLLAGCGTLHMADDQQDAARKAFAVAPDKAGLYVYRNEHMGGMVTMKLSIDGAPAGRTGAMTYVYRDVTPGRHKLTSHAENDDSIEFDAKPGTLTFIWQEVKMGLLSARTKLHLVGEEQGRKGVQETRLVRGE